MDIIQTKRLLLRPFNPKDMEAIYQLFSCEKVNTYLPWLPLKSKSEATTFYEEKLTGLNDTQYAICLKEDDIPIGYINISLKGALRLRIRFITVSLATRNSYRSR